LFDSAQDRDYWRALLSFFFFFSFFFLSFFILLFFSFFRSFFPSFFPSFVSFISLFLSFFFLITFFLYLFFCFFSFSFFLHNIIAINARNLVDSAQDRDYWRALVNEALHLRVPQAMELVYTREGHLCHFCYS
jgi:hypothetical protein